MTSDETPCTTIFGTIIPGKSQWLTVDCARFSKLASVTPYNDMQYIPAVTTWHSAEEQQKQE